MQNHFKKLRFEGRSSFRKISFVLCIVSALAFFSARAEESTLLNVSFDISRELYQGVNGAFAKEWKKKTGEEITIKQSHAGSTKQARAVIDGLEADVVTFNQVTDVDAVVEKSKLIPDNWKTLLPNSSSPYTSTIVFLVRKGNPKGIKDWDDLIKPDVAVIVPNPKTSGNGRYSYLSAYGFALKKFNQNTKKADEFIAALFKNVPVLDSGGRAATTTFVEHKLGDVLLNFEAEAFLTQKQLGADKFDVVNPSLSIEAEMPVAVVEGVAKKHGTEKVAEAYLRFLYTDDAQEIIAKNFFRPRSEAITERYKDQFGKIALFTVDDVFGGWSKAQKTHFADGGVFDRIYQAKR